MANHYQEIFKTSRYYCILCGGNRWSDNSSDALEMTSSEADALMVNTDGKNGGWTGAVKEST